MTKIKADKKIPQFKTRRLFMNGVCLKDAPFYQKHFACWDIIQYLNSGVPYPYPEGEAERFLKYKILPRQGRDLWMWALFLKEKPEELIGAIELRRKGDPGQRGFWLARHLWRKGLMSEAVLPVLDYAFYSLGFDRLILAHPAGNKASRRIKEKTHCRFIERRPKNFVNPNFKLAEIWELDKKTWERES